MLFGTVRVYSTRNTHALPHILDEIIKYNEAFALFKRSLIKNVFQQMKVINIALFFLLNFFVFVDVSV